MGLFTKCCRNAGLMIHYIIRPLPQNDKSRISHKVEQKKISPSVTLRRTTTEEIEVKKND